MHFTVTALSCALFILLNRLKFFIDAKLSYEDISQVELQDAILKLWASDEYRFRSTLNYQSPVKRNEKHDSSPAKLFNESYESVLKKPTTRSLLKIYELYDNADNRKDAFDQTELEKRSNLFLEEVMKSEEIDILRKALLKYGDETGSIDKFHELLHKIWFSRYARRSSGKIGSSAFQHVFVGEIDERKEQVKGMHNWIRFATLERRGDVDYAGFIKKGDYIAAIRYRWKGNWKLTGSMFLGTSPEFDLSVFTLCALSRPGRNRCSFILGDCTQVNVTTFKSAISNQKTGRTNLANSDANLATVYPDKFKKLDKCPLKIKQT